MQWYTTTGQEPNLTQLAQASLPAGRGRRDGVPKCKHKHIRKAANVHETVVLCRAMRPLGKPLPPLGCSKESSGPLGTLSTSSDCSMSPHPTLSASTYHPTTYTPTVLKMLPCPLYHPLLLGVNNQLQTLLGHLQSSYIFIHSTDVLTRATGTCSCSSLNFYKLQSCKFTSS